MDRRDFLKLSLAGMAVGLLPRSPTPAAELQLPAAQLPRRQADAMKILIITGSPRRDGNSNTLASEFARGAREAGHAVTRFDSAFMNIHPCTGCNHCGMDGDCIFDDDFTSIRSVLIDADLVAFATPMYYFGVSAQLKAAIDRFYAVNGRIHVKKQAVLLMTYANTAPSQAEPIRSHYDVLLRYLGWTDAGTVIAPGVWPVGAIGRTPYPGQAYELGRGLRA